MTLVDKYWTASDWARIELIARKECELRESMRGRLVGGLTLLSLTGARSSYQLELRQWAAIAGASAIARRSYAR